MSTKRALLVASHGMERAFHDVNTGGLSEDGPPNAADASGKGVGLLISFFQRREYFDLEASRMPGSPPTDTPSSSPSPEMGSHFPPVSQA